MGTTLASSALSRIRAPPRQASSRCHPDSPASARAFCATAATGLRINLYNPAAPASTTNIPTRCFAEDYFIASPQFTTTTFHGNFSHNNYHSMQVHFTLRPTQGSSFQGTYTLQKLLSDRYNTYVDVRHRQADYSLDYASILHEFRMNGTFELPFGPNQILFGNSSGWLARALEKWNVSMIYNVGTGAPRDTFTTQKLYAGGGGNQPQARPDIVGPWKNPQTNYLWNGLNNKSGTIYGYPSPNAVYDDPQCADRLGTADSMGFPGEPTYNIQDANSGRVTTRQGAPRSFQAQVRLGF
jgi:hypothetical protein